MLYLWYAGRCFSNSIYKRKRVQKSACKYFLLQENIHILIIFFLSLRGSTQKKIEEEMGVKIILPSSKKDDSISKFGLVIIYVDLVYGHYDQIVALNLQLCSIFSIIVP